MTDRVNGFLVTLEHDIRVDDAQPLMDAILQLRGVISVTPNVSDIEAHLAQERVRLELRKKLWEVLEERAR